ncbi:forkhead protein FKH, partial [Lecanoromycetidae sp. Uapishka_2]
MSTPTRRSERKRAANTRLAELPSSPTQPRSQPANKKRKANTAVAPTAAPSRRRRQKTPEEEPAEEEEDSSDGTAADSEDLSSQDAINEIVQCLTFPDYVTAVAEKYPNAKTEEVWGQGSVTAYARIQGRDWSYYVKKPVTYFGRAPGPLDPQSMSANAESSVQNSNEEEESVDVDLGPSKVVSRSHAKLEFSDDKWFVSVRGRNGLKIDDIVIRKGESKVIHSGTIIAIANTEMLFHTAGVKPDVDQIYLDRIAAPTDNNMPSEELANSQRQILPAHSPAKPPRQPVYSSNPTPTPQANGQMVMVHAPYPTGQPVTPDRTSPPKRNANGSTTKKKSPGTGNRGKAIMMESTEQIDYSLADNREIKPQCSYASMITWAITSTEEQSMSLNNIYEWIKAHYAYYRFAGPAWQNSIRHNLSLSPTFEKIPRRPDEPGKGMKWQLALEHRQHAIASANKQAGKGGGRVSSVPGTPTGLTAGFVPPPMNGNPQSSPSAPTPPVSSYPQMYQESLTPTRAPHMPAYAPAYAPTQGPIPVLSDQTSPMPIRGRNEHFSAVDSSPTLTSGAWSTDAPMRTPAPRPYNLAPPQPNTNKLPTSYMPESSPAPFWKAITAFGSTPAGRFLESSPLRNGTTGTAPGTQSSSPPVPTNGADSPTRKSAAKPPLFDLGSSSQTNGINGTKEDDDDGEIDLSKYEHDYYAGVRKAGCSTLTGSRGFTSIGTFHQQRSQVAASGIPS